MVRDVRRLRGQAPTTTREDAMTAPSTSVQVWATDHRWRIETDTGWQQGWWSLTRRGLVSQVKRALHACGIPITTKDATHVVALARKYGHVTIGPEDKTE